jgi:membrane protein DedA with SNARE-associated domain
VSFVSTAVDHVLQLHGLPAYAIVGGLAFAEAALFVGFVLPGETAVFLGGVLADRGQVSLPVMILVSVVSAIVGDSVGYEVGRHYGTKLLGLSVFDHRQDGIERARQGLRRRGGRAVFLARFTAFLRAVMPGLAGMAHLPYRRFLAFNAAGGIVWAVGYTLLGYLAGASYKRVEKYAGRASEIVLGVVVVAFIAWVVVHRRRERDKDD